MTKEEVIALGVPEDKVKEFRELYYRDVQKAAERLERNSPADYTRSAIIKVLKLIKSPEALTMILHSVNKAYYNETKPAEPEA